MIEQTPKAPTIDDLRRIRDQGVTQKLYSGIEVRMRPVTPEKLLSLGHIPDILSPIMLKGLYAGIQEDLDEFLLQPRDKTAEAMEMVNVVNMVCEAALLEPDIVPYLELSDRMCVFKLAFLPAEALSRFRLQPEGDVETATNGEGNGDKAKRAAVRERRAGRVPV